MKCHKCKANAPVYRTTKPGVINKVWVCEKCLPAYPEAPQIDYELRKVMSALNN